MKAIPRKTQTRAYERMDDDGIIERLCIKCGCWVVLEHFAKSVKCYRGRTRECLDCKNKRKLRNDRLRTEVAQ